MTRKPNQLHRLTGSYRADRHGQEITVPNDTPTPPAWLSAAAREQWDAIAPTLQGLGLSSSAFTIGMALLADALADYAKASVAAAGVPYHVTASTGSLQVHPAWTAKSQAWHRALKALREFGLSPSSVHTVKAIEPPAPSYPRLSVSI